MLQVILVMHGDGERTSLGVLELEFFYDVLSLCSILKTCKKIII